MTVAEAEKAFASFIETYIPMDRRVTLRVLASALVVAAFEEAARECEAEAAGRSGEANAACLWLASDIRALATKEGAS